MATKKTETKTETTDIVKPQTAALAGGMSMEDLAGDAGLGMETADRSAFAIPFIKILQAGSPEIETVDAAKPGMFINTITGELYREVLVVPCSYQRQFLRWAPRDAGGGYKGALNPIDVETGAIKEVKRDAATGAFTIVKTADGSWQPALLSLASTQIKKSKRWMSRIQGIELRTAAGKPFNPPSFSHIYKLTTKKEENAKGNWHGVEIDLVGPVQEAETYAKAKAFHASVAKGEVEVAPPEREDGTSDSGKF
jgi:hypothetical protein